MPYIIQTESQVFMGFKDRDKNQGAVGEVWCCTRKKRFLLQVFNGINIIQWDKHDLCSI